MVHNEFLTVLKWALVVGFLSGIIAFLLGGVLSSFATGAMGQVLISLFLIIALIALKKGAKIDDVSLYEIVILFASITFFGSLFGMFVPQISPFILTIGNSLTVSGLLFTFLYIAIAEFVLTKLNIKQLA